MQRADFGRASPTAGFGLGAKKGIGVSGSWERRLACRGAQGMEGVVEEGLKREGRAHGHFHAPHAQRDHRDLAARALQIFVEGARIGVLEA